MSRAAMLITTVLTLALALVIAAYRSDAESIPSLWHLNSVSNVVSQLPLLPKFDHIKPESKWDILYHLGGNGPWIRKTDGIVDERLDAPVGCRVDQVHMVGLPRVSSGMP